MSEPASAPSVERASGGWTIDEWFVVALARTIRDREVVFHGFASPCAQVAMHVARRTHARDVLLVEGATYAVNPDPVFIPPTSNDLALHRDAVYRMRFEEFFDAATRGAVDRMFLSGGQIDGYGNTNVTAIGDPARPKIKLGGGGGGCNISATIGTLTLWTTRHRSGRTLVPKLDFLTDIGHVTPSGSRAELGYTGGGPQWLITELGVFDYGPDGHARLRAIWPDVTVGDVRDATGFELRVELEHGILHPPSTGELAALRAVDPLGVRRLEFGPDELKRRFDHHGSTSCAC
ncbi:MAG: glutaconate CoA-transferase, subunit [Pseudonocardiales bacterium]|nr:glutaconate CoA-transferase, subunit [Pseudonocardiales bacterium]MDT7647108.1 glutaconate CoA-transferase, subunit [Pseudonocardiales bacterium]